MSIFLWIVGAIALYIVHRQSYPKQRELPKGRIVSRGPVTDADLDMWREYHARLAKFHQDQHDARERADAVRMEAHLAELAESQARYERQEARYNCK